MGVLVDVPASVLNFTTETLRNVWGLTSPSYFLFDLFSILVLQMRQSKRMRSSDGWLSEYSWEERLEIRKRPRRRSRSGDRDRKPRRHHHYKTYER